MAVRDLSPSSWVAPAVGRLAIAIQHSADDSDPIPMDVWINNYSPSSDEMIDLASGFNAIAVDSTHGRIICFIPPRGNTAVMTLKGVTGDTGIPLNPQGPTVISLPATSPYTTFGITCAGDVVGCRLIVI